MYDLSLKGSNLIIVLNTLMYYGDHLSQIVLKTIQ
jgi:hypothetical protein